MSSAAAASPKASQPAATPAKAPRRSIAQELGLVVVVLLLGGILAIYGWQDAGPGRPNTFLNFDNLIDGIATPMSYYAIMAIGVTIVIITGGIDISVGSIMALAALGGAAALQNLPPDASAVVVLPIAYIGAAWDRSALRVDQWRTNCQSQFASLYRDAGNHEHFPRVGECSAASEDLAFCRQGAPAGVYHRFHAHRDVWPAADAPHHHAHLRGGRLVLSPADGGRTGDLRDRWE